MARGTIGPSPKRRELLGLGVAYAALALWWHWPLPRLMQEHALYAEAGVAVVPADIYLTLWILAWGAHALVTQPWALFNANSFYPSTLSLAYAEHLLGYVPMFGPFYWTTDNPVLALNATILLSYPLCALAAFALARRFVGGPAAAVAGFFYAFSVRRYLSSGHPHMLGVQYIPFAMLLTERWLESGRRRDAVLLAAALALQALSSIYLAYALALAYVPYLAVALWRWRARLDRRRLAGLALAGASAGALVVATSLPYFRLRQLGLIPAYDQSGFALGLVPYFTHKNVWGYLSNEGVGPVGYALALVALAPRWRPRGLVVTAVALVVTGVVLSFGPHILWQGRLFWSPYSLLVAFVPGFSAVRLPVRFLVVAQLGFALLAAVGAGRLVGRMRGWLAWPAAAAACAGALWSFHPHFTVIPLQRELTGAKIPTAYRWLALHGEGRALMEFPRGGPKSWAHRMYLSTYHWLPVVDGYAGYPPRTPEFLYGIARALPSHAALQELVDHVDVGWILVHRSEYPGRARAPWDAALPAGLERAGEWGPDLLLRVTLPPRNDRRARLLDERETLGGVPLAPLATCPGSLAVVSPPPDPWRPLGSAKILIRVRNAGGAPWPAFGFLPRHLVRLDAALHPAGGSPGPALEVPLPQDVPPGGQVTVSVEMKAPMRVGDYVLELGLVQVGDGPLARCGVAPLGVPVRVGVAAATPRSP